MPSDAHGHHHVSRPTLAALLLFLVAVAALSILASAYLNHPAGRTGAPGEGTCQGCHGSYNLNYGDGYVMVNNLPESYRPSTTYNLNVTVYSPDMNRWCFEITVKAAMENHPVGSFTVCEERATCLSEDLRYIMSTRYGCGNAVEGLKTWEFQWTSPSRAESDLTFYAVGMGENGGGTNGDIVYTCMMRINAPPRVPDKPAGLLAEPGDCRATLTWFMPAFDPMGCEDDAFRIYWSDQPSGGLQLLCEVNGTSYVHTGLVNGRSYRYQVAGLNAEGEGPLSDMVSCVPANVPTAPRGLGSSIAQDGAVALSWQSPTSWGSGSSGTYTVMRGEQPWSMTVVAQGLSAPSFVDSELPCRNITYHYRIRATTSTGAGEGVMVCVEVPPGRPADPLAVTATAMSGRVELHWQPPTEDGGDPVRYYNVYRTVAGGTPQLLAERLTCMDYNDTSCMFGTAYEYTVTAENVAGEGAMSTAVEAQLALPATELRTAELDLGDVPFAVVGAVGAVLCIGVAMVGRLAYASRDRSRDGQ